MCHKIYELTQIHYLTLYQIDLSYSAQASPNVLFSINFTVNILNQLQTRGKFIMHHGE